MPKLGGFPQRVIYLTFVKLTALKQRSETTPDNDAGASEIGRRIEFEIGWRIEFEIGRQIEFEIGRRIEFEIGRQIEFEIGRQIEFETTKKFK